MVDLIRVLIVDDHSLVRDSLATRLSLEEDIEVIGAAPDADAGLEFALAHQPSLILMDTDMPGRQCFDACRTVRARLPETKLVFLSAHATDHYIEEALRLEASGYLTKHEAPEVVVRAIRAIAAGETIFSPEVEARVVNEGRGARNGDIRTRVGQLSPREREVLRYIARGLSKKEIAASMHISVKTVDNHSTSLMSKLDLHDRVDLARFAIREGLVEA